MDEVQEPGSDHAERRLRMREGRRRAARHRGHVRLAVAITLLLAVMMMLCWAVSAVRTAVGGRSADQVAGAPAAADTAPGPRTPTRGMASLAPAKGAFAAPRLALLDSFSAVPINSKFSGITMFRGNATRTFYGEGPVPKHPKILWEFPREGRMSAMSAVAGHSKFWAGTGWTGQPIVAERNGRTEVIFGAYDKKIHFLDAKTGERVRPDFATRDIIKGTVTLDPDGYPILYSGSRDNFYHVIALDRPAPAQLWSLWAYSVKNAVWNDDWDGNGLIVNDYLFEGGENSHFFIVKLNRGYGADHKVTVDPKVVLDFEAFDQGLFDAIGDKEVSIENSPAMYKDRVYFSNSGGLVWGLDVSRLSEGRIKPVLKWWTGDDTDASIVVDDDGMLYVASELQRHLPRAKENGQIMKLNPYKPKNPLVWGIKVPPEGNSDGLGGCWATPALHGDMLYEPTHPGALLGINKKTGKIVWKKSFSWHAWGSASVVDDTLIVPDTSGTIHAYDVRNPRVDPPELWQVSVPSGSAIESTPVNWRGRIYVGARDGKFYCFGDK